MIAKFAFIATLVFLPCYASADVYSWEDKDGMHFVDDPGKVPVKYQDRMKSDTNAERIRVTNEFKGYTKNGVKTDKAWNVELAIHETAFRGELAKCSRKFAGGTPEIKACEQLVLEQFKTAAQNIPPHIIKSRRQQLR